MSWRLWASAVFAHAADTAATAFALGMGGHEGSPAAAAALGALGLPGLVALKAAGLAAIAGVWAAGRRRWAAADWAVPAITALCGLVPAIWNISQILLYGGVVG